MKHVRECNLVTEYENDPTINMQVRMLTAWAFVPVADVPAVVEELQEYVDERLNDLMDYTEDNYIGRRYRNGKEKPRLALEWWNVYERTLDGDPRTNNNAEAGHRRSQSEFDSSHPSLWTFIQTLKKFQKAWDTEYTEDEKGNPPPLKRKKYAQVDASIRTIVTDYSNHTAIEYLSGLANNL